MKANQRSSHGLFNEQGQALTEYITLMVLIALVGVGAAQSIGKLVREKMMTARSHIDTDINFDDVHATSTSKRKKR